MSLRRRIALFLDPALLAPASPPEQETDPDRIEWLFRRYDPEVAHYLGKIARTLESMERTKRRPRNVWCEHPELHPELEEIAS